MKEKNFKIGVLLISSVMYSQVGINTGNPDPSSNLTVAPLDYNNNTKGTLLSVMTTAQRSTIASPATGLIVYDTDLKCMMTNNGTPAAPLWECVSGNDINIYNADGTLTANRTVMVDGSTLNFRTGSPNIRETKIDHTGSGNALYHRTSTGNAIIQLQGGSSLLNIGQRSNGNAYITTGVLAANTTGISVGTTASSTGNVELNTAGVTRMRVFPDGKISMLAQVTGPLLTVNGSIQTAGNTYPDYVFENYFKGSSELKKEYGFKSLKEVENFISINSHLPGVTSIKELQKNEKGEYLFNISELSIQMLEKIEELYLYTIEQQKLIESKEAEINILKENAEVTMAKVERLEKLMLDKQRKNQESKKRFF